MVRTPLWFAPLGNDYYIFSAAAGKVKRLRNFSNASLTPCDAIGKPLGEESFGQATLISDAQDIALAMRALKAKYGWLFSTTNLFSKLAGKFHKRAYIKVTL